MSRRILSRDDLLRLLYDRLPESACRASVLTGKAVVLGAFDAILPSLKPGWIVDLISVRGRTWHIAVQPTPTGHEWYVRRLEAVPWASWAGDRVPCRVLDTGDKPEACMWSREQARKDVWNPISSNG